MARFLSNNQIVSAIAASVKAATEHGYRVPTTLIQGENGIGKTDILKQLRGHPVLQSHIFCPIVDCQNLDIGDHSIPIPDMALGVTRNLPNERYSVNAKNAAGIAGSRPIVLLLDELGKSARHVQASLAPVFYDHRIGAWIAPPGSVIVATTNLSREGLGDTMFAHTLNRITVVNMRKPTAQEWIVWALNNDIHPMIIACANQNAHWFDSFVDTKYDKKDLTQENPVIFNPSANQEAYWSPRSAERASQILHGELGVVDDETLQARLEGTVGAPAMADLMAIIQLDGEVVRFEEVVADPMGARLTKNAIAQIIQTFNLITRTTTRAEAEAVMTYVERLREESQSLFVNKVSGSGGTKAGMFSTVKKFTAMLVRHQVAYQAGR